MFWRFGFQTQSAIDQLLDKEELSLQDLLDEEELIQEVKAHNKKLLDFLCRADVLEALLSYITDDPDTDLGEKNKFRYPCLASEIFNCEVLSICDALVSNPGLLDSFWKFLESPAPLNPIQCSYFSKLFCVLLQKKPAETWAFFKKLDKPIDILIRHLGTSAIMDLLLKFVTLEEIKEGDGMFQWLSDEQLVYKLVLNFDPNLHPDFHSNASQTIVDLMAISQGIRGQNELIDQLKSPVTVSKFIEYMSQKDSANYQSSLGAMLTVLIEFIQRSLGFFEIQSQSDMYYGTYESQPREEDIVEILKQIEPKLELLHNVMVESKPPSVDTAVDAADPKNRTPLGSLRLKLIEFFVVLLHANNKEINQKFIDLKIVPCYIDLFFRYELNNFLHSLIHDMLVKILGTDLELWPQLCLSTLKEGRLLDRIARASKENDAEVEEPKGYRKPYMGHLTLISNHLIKFSTFPELTQDIKDIFEGSLWKEYERTALLDTNMRNSKPLGGHRPLNQTDSDFMGHGETGDSSHDQFSRFLCHQITSNLPDKFGEDDDFDIDNDEVVNVNFDMAGQHQSRPVFDDDSESDEEEISLDDDDTFHDKGNPEGFPKDI